MILLFIDIAAVKPSEEIELVKTPGPEPEQQAAIETESAEQNLDTEEQVPAEEEGMYQLISQAVSLDLMTAFQQCKQCTRGCL